MSGFLDGYGVEDARREKREKLFKRSLIAVLVVAVASLALYFGFRNFSEKRQIQRFVDLLKQKNYEGAYQLWGCSAESPCREYTLAEFMKDWGPNSPHADLSSLKIARMRSCSTGIIQTLDFGKGEQVDLWVERKDQNLGFAPWPVCSPRMKAP